MTDSEKQEKIKHRRIKSLRNLCVISMWYEIWNE